MTADHDSPTGLDMNPRPPATVRVRKGVGVAAVFALGILAMLIVYGVYDRRHRQLKAATTYITDSKTTPAISASREFTSTIPVGNVPALEPDMPSLENQSQVSM